MPGDIRILIVGKANLMRDGLWAFLCLQDGCDVLPAIESSVSAIDSVAFEQAPEVALVQVPSSNTEA